MNAVHIHWALIHSWPYTFLFYNIQSLSTQFPLHSTYFYVSPNTGNSHFSITKWGEIRSNKQLLRLLWQTFVAHERLNAAHYLSTSILNFSIHFCWHSVKVHGFIHIYFFYFLVCYFTSNYPTFPPISLSNATTLDFDSLICSSKLLVALYSIVFLTFSANHIGSQPATWHCLHKKSICKFKSLTYSSVNTLHNQCRHYTCFFLAQHWSILFILMRALLPLFTILITYSNQLSTPCLCKSYHNASLFTSLYTFFKRTKVQWIFPLKWKTNQPSSFLKAMQVVLA